MTLRIVGAIIVAAFATFGIGWLVGASGRAGAERQLAVVEERADFAQARALISDGRVSLFLVNFGDASKRFEEARGLVEKAQTRLREEGQAERAGRLEIVADAPQRRATDGRLARFRRPGRRGRGAQRVGRAGNVPLPTSALSP